MCGCVRGPKEECYVDPNKAPLTPGSKELRGGRRRYFQRKKKRKSGDFQPTDSLRSRGGDSVQSETQDDDQDFSLGRQALESCEEKHEEASATGGGGYLQVEEECRPKLGSISRGVYVGEIPVLVKVSRGGGGGGVSSAARKRLALAHGWRRSSDPEKVNLDGDGDDLGAAAAVSGERSLHSVTKASRRVAPKKDSLLEKRLLKRQLSRAVSFGAVEHMLRTLRAGGGGRKAEDRMLEDMKGLPRLICSTQVHRKRRRGGAQTSVNADEETSVSISQASLDGVQQPVKYITVTPPEVASAFVSPHVDH